MSTAVAVPMTTSGSARRRAKVNARRTGATALVHRIEDKAFFEHGTIPDSSTAFTLCSCGGRAFTREEHGDLDDFDEAHAYCDVDVFS